MDLKARVLVSNDGEIDFDFPEPGHEIVSRTLDIAVQMLLGEDHRKGVPEVHKAIGYDATSAARKHWAAHAEKSRQDQKAGIEVADDDEIKQDFRIAVRAISLELIAGLFLSVLDSPKEARCPCCAPLQDGKAIPYGAAPQGNPDARAAYGEFTTLAEVTTIFNLRKSDINDEWDSAYGHVDVIEDVPLIYRLIVSRLGLDDDRRWQAARLVEAREKLEDRKAGDGGGPVSRVRNRGHVGNRPQAARALLRGWRGQRSVDGGWPRYALR